MKVNVLLIRPANPRMARAIGAALNQKGADRLTVEELRAAADDLVALGFPDDEIARELGRTAEWARKFRKRSNFNDRFDAHPAAQKVSYTVAEQLVEIGLDKPVTAILDAVEQGVTIDGPWAKRAKEAANAAHSETEAVKAVEQVLQEKKATVQGPDGRKNKPSASDALLKAIKRLQGDAEVLTKLQTPLNSPMADTFRDVLRELQDAISVHLRRLGTSPAEDAA
jgi:hypothetical protein